MESQSSPLVLAVVTWSDGASRALELVAAAQIAAAALQARVGVLVTAAAGAGLAAGVATSGADHAYRMAPPLARRAPSGVTLAAIERACIDLAPSLVLLMADSVAMEIAPRLAHRLHAAYVSNCIAIEPAPDGQRLSYTRPVHGGRALEVLASASPLTVVTIKAKCFEPSPQGARSACQWTDISHATAAADSGIEFVSESAAGGSAEAKLEEAGVIVAGGRGLGNADGFVQLKELAALLDGAVGASRAAVDAGWVPKAMQVGQTGKTVAPELYIAVGISGAVQHLTGMVGAKHIIAINSDEEAPIFGVANLGAVGDCREILPALIGELKKPAQGK